MYFIRKIVEAFPSVKKAGLLATSGTVGSNVYAVQLNKKGIELIVPNAQTQEKLVMQAIYGEEGIKAGCKTGLPRKLLLQAAKELVDNGAELVILGCTEIPLVLKDGDFQIPFIDPSDILAKSAVKHAMKKIKPGYMPPKTS